MGRKTAKQSKLTDIARVAFVPLTLIQYLKELTNKLLLPVAFLTGAAGMVALVACLVLLMLPPDRWPPGLDPNQLPIYMTLSLVASSLLGWGCMQTGLSRLRNAFGKGLGGWLFVLLPVVCAAITVLGTMEVIEPSTWPGAPWTARAVRWYPPLIILVSLGAYLWTQLRQEGEDRLARNVGSIALVLPYVALLATLVLGVESPLLSESLRDAVESLGSGAIVVQMILAYFLSPSAGR
ncbi:MAG: hypothetical protein JKY65_03510 [Planctomycetes bacterium]|nr:hypothetical protein [Planctomycetota bacterium]